MIEEPLTAYSEPIGPQWHEGPPFQWKEGRAARAEAAFQKARDATIRACSDKAQKETEDAQRIKDLESQTKAQIAKVSRYENCCRLTRACVEEAVTKAVSDTTAATNPPEHALRFPLYTILRPLVVLANPGASPSSDPPAPAANTMRPLFASRTISQKGGSSPRAQPGLGSPRVPDGGGGTGGSCSQSHPEDEGCGFAEALFVRGLVSTLMANASVLSDAGVVGGEAGGAGEGVAEAGAGPVTGVGAAPGAGAAQRGGLERGASDGRSSENSNWARQLVRRQSTLRWSDPGNQQQRQQQQQQRQEQQGSNVANAQAPPDPNIPTALDPAINGADALQLCIGILRGTEGPHSCSVMDSPAPRNNLPLLPPSPRCMSGSSRASTHSLHKVESFGCSADGSKAGSRLSKPAGPGTSLESGFKEEGCGLRPRGIIPASSRCTATSEVHQTKAAAAHSAYAHQTKAATALQARQAAFKVATASELHHEGSIQGSSADSTPSSWQSCSSLLPSECSADSLTYQEQPQHQHDFRIVQCYPQGGLQLVDDGPKGRATYAVRKCCLPCRTKQTQ
uniref:Uncharacterized protein n=1 Tax=Dunaliella tertiolecta TaxID=3047 RepID=A0A7S3R395_DUNTE